MIKIFNYVKQYIHEFYNQKLYLSVAVLLIVCISFNFWLDFEDSYIDKFYGSPIRWLMYFGWMSFPFLSVCGLLYAYDLKRDWIRSRDFWVLFFVGFLVISFERSFTYHHLLLKSLDFDSIDRRFLIYTTSKIRPVFITVFSLLVFYFFYDRSRDTSGDWYGLNFKSFDFKPYAFLIIVVFVGIAAASFLGDLTQYYPRYLKTGGARFAMKHDLNWSVPVLVYESAYGLGFLGVEFFFRGFLVIGFARILGGYAVLAMVGPYVFLHFGKPITECISSAFGGYLIGILAYYSRHIWGGVLLHVSLAWSMELFGWLQKVYDD